jgi:hypothetical protein
MTIRASSLSLNMLKSSLSAGGILNLKCQKRCNFDL